MTSCKEYQDYIFLTDDNYQLELIAANLNCLVKVKLFNKIGNDDFEKSIYLEFPNASNVFIKKDGKYQVNKNKDLI